MMLRMAVFISAFLFALPSQLGAQAVFEAFGFPKSATATGHTEVLGSVHVLLRLGSAYADTLVVDVSPLRITNRSASDIQITTSGNMTTGAVTIEAEEGRVLVPLNAGGNNGFVRVDGIRVAIAGRNLSSITARLSWGSRQNVFSPRDSVVVVDQVRSGLIADLMTDRFTVVNNAVVDNSATITVREGYEGAFVSAPDFGQNTPTQIRIRITEFPTGLRMRFPATVDAKESGATLTTVEGALVDLPRSDGATEVTYKFNGTSTSAGTRESFDIPFTVSVPETVANLQPTIDVSLAPIGVAVPSDAFPSTDIPRFAEENLLVLEGTSRIFTRTSFWTGIETSADNRLSVFNSSSASSRIALSAFDSAGRLLVGSNITNPVSLVLSAHQSSDQNLMEIFGTGATSIATVRVQSVSSEVVAIGTISGSGFSESVPLLDRAIANFMLPLTADDTRLHIVNAGSVPVSGVLTMRTPQGAVVATKTVSLDPLASTSPLLKEFFGNQGQGQITGSFTGSVIVSASFGGPGSLNVISAQPPAGTSSLYLPFFAAGSGYETDLHLFNSSDQTVTLRAELVDNRGPAAKIERPITLGPAEVVATTISQLFQLQTLTAGYLRIQVPQFAKGFFTFYPGITGHARIRSAQGGSTTIPVSTDSLAGSSILTAGTTAGQFQGIALVNPGTSNATVTLEALNPSGTVVSIATVSLASGQITSKQVTEYFSVSIPARSVIRVSSSAPIVATSITGSLSGDVLRAVPALR